MAQLQNVRKLKIETSHSGATNEKISNFDDEKIRLYQK